MYRFDNKDIINIIRLLDVEKACNSAKICTSTITVLLSAININCINWGALLIFWKVWISVLFTKKVTNKLLILADQYHCYGYVEHSLKSSSSTFFMIKLKRKLPPLHLSGFWSNV